MPEWYVHLLDTDAGGQLLQITLVADNAVGGPFTKPGAEAYAQMLARRWQLTFADDTPQSVGETSPSYVSWH